MKISIIAAIGKNRELGKNNKLLWDIPEDLKRFRSITAGHTVIMGRKTFESIGRALPNRTNIIVTRDKNYKAVGCIISRSLEGAIDLAKRGGGEEVFVIGGGEIYRQAISLADKLYLTLVEGTFDADTFFPDYSGFRKVIFQEKHKDENYSYTFLEMEKR